MLRRVGGYLKARSTENVPAESVELESLGYTVLRDVLNAEEVQTLHQEISQVFDQLPPDIRAVGKSTEDDEMFRYEMLNRSAACQRMVAHPVVLAVIEPLLGEDCHVIANTAWRNPAGHPGSHGGQAWHVDAGPHVPLPKGVTWPDDIPHPVFAIGCHIYLQDCSLDDGPTGVIPGSHLSGQFPPREQVFDDQLDFQGKQVEPLITKAGDIGLFVSDVWHRRMPTGPNDQGRFFLQVHYARRDIAQRLRTTADSHQLSDEALARMQNDRDRSVAGLHNPGFYDG